MSRKGFRSNGLQLNKSRTLVLVKARPHASEQYTETVCCAGLDADGKWARLFPVPFRRLQQSQQFARWDWIEYDWYKPKNDTRTESRHIQEGSIKVTGKVTKRDRDRILQGVVQPSLETTVKKDMTLALLVPENPKFKMSAKPETQLNLEQRAYKIAANQGSLFSDDMDAMKPCPFEFRYDWADSEGHSHSHDCGDWETGATFFRWRRKYGEEKALKQMAEVFGERYPSEGMAFALGTHSRRPKQWLLVGVLRLNPTEQISLL